LEQAVASTAQKMIEKPTDAWMAALPILFIAGALLTLIGVYFLARYVMANNQTLTDKIMSENGLREERYIRLIEGPVKDMTVAVAGMCQDMREIKDDLEELKRK
jgi:hypothetical protein